jgi:undecaprenyl-diphosphatase
MRRAIPYLVLVVLILGLLATPRGVALDHWLVERAVALDRESSLLDASMRLGSLLGKRSPILVGLLVPSAFGGEVARVTVRVAAVGVGANWVVTEVLKSVTNRTRPSGERPRRNSSFPSGHASTMAALARVAYPRHRRLGAWLWALTAWVSVSRIFLGVHYPSDALAGVLLGALIGASALRFGVLLGSAAAASAVVPTSQPLRP